MNSKPHIVDANFILRYLLADIPAQYTIAADFFSTVRTGKTKIILTETVLTEVILILASNYQVTKNRITSALTNLLRYKGIIITDKEVICKALEIYAISELHITDAILAAHICLHSLQLISFNDDLKKFISSATYEQ